MPEVSNPFEIPKFIIPHMGGCEWVRVRDAIRWVLAVMLYAPSLQRERNSTDPAQRYHSEFCHAMKIRFGGGPV
jgi:hypothetical protein